MTTRARWAMHRCLRPALAHPRVAARMSQHNSRHLLQHARQTECQPGPTKQPSPNKEARKTRPNPTGLRATSAVDVGDGPRNPNRNPNRGRTPKGSRACLRLGFGGRPGPCGTKRTPAEHNPASTTCDTEPDEPTTGTRRATPKPERTMPRRGRAKHDEYQSACKSGQHCKVSCASPEGQSFYFTCPPSPSRKPTHKEPPTADCRNPDVSDSVRLADLVRFGLWGAALLAAASLCPT